MKAHIRIGRAYEPLLTCQDPFLFVEGPRGTAKTRSILTILVLRLLKYPGSRLLLCRKTRVDLSNTVLATLEGQVFPALGLPVPGGADRANRSEYKLPNGSRILPIGIDEGSKLYSAEATFGYVAEAIELTESQVTDVAGCMRWIQSPERMSLPDWSQVIVDANPGPPAHWVNRKAEDVDNGLRFVRTREDYERLQAFNETPAPDPVHRWRRIITRHQDNPGYWDFDAWGYTKLGQKYVGETLETLSGYKRARWLDGLWKSAEGAVFPEFDEDKHVIAPFEIPKEWPSWLAEDPGYDHPTAIVIASMAPNKRLYISAEIVRRQTTVEQDAADIKRSIIPNFNIRRMLGDPHYMFSANKHNSGKSIAQQMRDHGLHFEPGEAASNQTDIAQQVEMVRTRLTTLGADGEPMLKVFRSCPNVINGFQTWGYQRNAKGEIKGGEDRFEDVGDDEMDCVRMLISANPTFEQPKAEVHVPARR